MIFENINSIIDEDNDNIQFNQNRSDIEDNNSLSSNDTVEDEMQSIEVTSTIKLNCHHKYTCIDIEKRDKSQWRKNIIK